MVNAESWAKAQTTSQGKPGVEAFNRPDVWLSALAGSVEMMATITEHHGPAASDSFLGDGAKKLWEPFFHDVNWKRTCEILNTEDFPHTSCSKEDTEIAIKKLLQGLGGLNAKWRQMADFALLAHNSYISSMTILTAVALAKHPAVMKSEFVNGKNMPTEAFQQWSADPTNGPKLLRFLSSQHFQEASVKRHNSGAPHGEEEVLEDAEGGIQWSPKARSAAPVPVAAASASSGGLNLRSLLDNLRLRAGTVQRDVQYCLDKGSIGRATRDKHLASLGSLSTEKSSFLIKLGAIKAENRELVKEYADNIKKVLLDLKSVMLLKDGLDGVLIMSDDEPDSLQFGTPAARCSARTPSPAGRSSAAASQTAPAAKGSARTLSPTGRWSAVASQAAAASHAEATSNVAGTPPAKRSRSSPRVKPPSSEMEAETAVAEVDLSAADVVVEDNEEEKSDNNFKLAVDAFVEQVADEMRRRKKNRDIPKLKKEYVTLAKSLRDAKKGKTLNKVTERKLMLKITEAMNSTDE